MAVIPLARQTQTNTQSPTVTLARPVGSGPDPVVAAVNEGMQGTSRLLDALAQQEREQLDRLYQTQIAADISELEVQERAEVMRLQAQGTGEEGFTTVAMRGFEERINKAAEKYSPELQERFKIRAMPLRQNIALAAATIEQNQYNAKIIANFDTVRNVAVSKVMFGHVDEQTALAEIDQDLQAVPDNLRLGEQLKTREAIRAAALQRAVMQNPQEAMARIATGEFAELNPVLQQRAYEAAQDAIQKQVDAEMKRQDRVRDLLAKDPFRAGQEALGDVTPEQNMQWQMQQGLPWYAAATISEAQAKSYAEQIKNTRDPDEMLAALSRIEAESQGNWPQVKRDIQRFANKEMPGLAYAMDVLAPSSLGDYHPLFRQGVFEAMRDPKAGAAAKAALKPEDATEIEKEVREALRDHFRASRPQSIVEEQQSMEFMLNAAFVTKLNADREGKEVDIKEAVTPPASVATLRVDNASAYYVPTSKSALLSKPRMEEFRRRLIAEEELRLPATMSDAMRLNTHLERDSGWRTGPVDGTLVLTVRGGFEVLDKNGKPLVVKIDDLAEAARQLVEWEKRRPVLTVKQNPRGTTRVKVVEPATPPPTPRLRPASIDLPVTQGGLRPPPAQGKRDESLFDATPRGNIELLPPPTYE